MARQPETCVAFAPRFQYPGQPVLQPFSPYREGGSWLSPPSPLHKAALPLHVPRQVLLLLRAAAWHLGPLLVASLPHRAG